MNISARTGLDPASFTYVVGFWEGPIFETCTSPKPLGHRATPYNVYDYKTKIAASFQKREKIKTYKMLRLKDFQQDAVE